MACSTSTGRSGKWTETWTFFDDLTYQHKYESYEGYVSPFGGGY